MSTFDRYLLDRNGDGFIDDASARILVSPASEVDIGRFWPALIDAAALLGLRAHALPLPLFVSERPDGVEVVTVRSLDDVSTLAGEDQPQRATALAKMTPATPSHDLVDLFTTSGLLTDLDGDLVPDATRFGIVLPDTMTPELGVALCNFAVRVGLESGGVTLPLVSSVEPTLTIDATNGDATLRVVRGGWRVEGAPFELAQLIEVIARQWPVFGMPETAGASAGVQSLADYLVDGGEDSDRQTPVAWELQWAAEPEVQRHIDAIERRLLPRLEEDSQLEVTVFACEPQAVRRRIERDLRQRIRSAGTHSASVRVLSAFKAGLSWLLEVVLPELDGAEIAGLEIQYRRFEPPAADDHLDMPIRWLQELFPGDEIAAARLGIPVDAIVFTENTSPEAPVYRATATGADGSSIGTWELDLLSYVMPFMPSVDGSEAVAVTTGGFIASLDGERFEHRVDTDLDRFWSFWQQEVLPRVIAGIESRGGFRADLQPFFGSLEVDLWLSAPNSRLGVREENESAAEALHEDIYFNTLDTIEVLGLKSTGDKTSAPGAVVPVIHVQAGAAPHAVVRLREAPAPRPRPPRIIVDELALENGEFIARLTPENDGLIQASAAELQERFAPEEPDAPSFAASLRLGEERIPLRLPLPSPLKDEDDTEAPPMDRNIHGSAVEAWSGRVATVNCVSAWIEGHSYQGRPVPALALHAPAPGRVWSPAKLAALKPTVLIVARHHANEISSTNAAFRLAHLVGTDPEWGGLIKQLNIVLIPYENADGAALHARLAASPDTATWKHHPARYNALGHEFGEDYFDPDTPFGEAKVRPALWRRWLPDAMVDNHGVPSHEWVQPFAGFGSPPRFRVSYWIPQALIYGIVRHVADAQFPEHAEAAAALRDAVAAAFQGTDIGELNRVIGASYRRWGQDRVPDRFPGEFHDDMLWHFGETPVDPEGRGFNVRFPKTTVLSWVTEVIDETATDAHLEMVARAHLIANRAMLDLVRGMDATVERSALDIEDGRSVKRFMRQRPLRS